MLGEKFSRTKSLITKYNCIKNMQKQSQNNGQSLSKYISNHLDKTRLLNETKNANCIQ